MEFNSDRKRMSVLLKDPIDGKIKLLIKGADSIIMDRLDKDQYPQDMQK
jgi:magnesium-transporting ATPase (P-type)